MALTSADAAAAQATMQLTRDNIVQRLLTTTQDATGPPRKDMTVLSFGNFSLGKEHHLDAIDLLVTAGVSPSRFQSVAEERLAGDDASHQAFNFTTNQDASIPCEVILTSNMLVRLWYLQSPAIKSMVAAHLKESRLFVELSDIAATERAGLDAAIGCVSSARFMHHFYDTRTQWLHLTGHEEDCKTDVKDIHDGSDEHEQFGSLKIGFHRKVPMFDPLEALEMDQKAADYGSLIHSSPPTKSFQPLRWRSKHTRDSIYYFLPALDLQNGAEAEQRICTLLGAVSAHYSPPSIQSSDMSDLEPDYGISYSGRSPSNPLAAHEVSSQDLQGPFPPADKVFHRIRWDESINENDVEIHYLDRHEGIMTKAFVEWLRDTEEEEFVPMHRIRVFVRRSDGAILWDRERRIHRLVQT